MNKIFFLLMFFNATSCTLIMPSAIKIINRSDYTIIVKSSKFTDLYEIEKNKTKNILSYPGNIDLTISDKLDVFSETFNITLGYQEAMEINFSIKE